MASEPTTRDWIRFVGWTIGVVYFGYVSIRAWMRYRQRPDWSVPPVLQSEVDQDEVESAVERSKERIEAIKELRVRYAGLGFRDARELVDRHSPK